MRSPIVSCPEVVDVIGVAVDLDRIILPLSVYVTPLPSAEGEVESIVFADGDDVIDGSFRARQLMDMSADWTFAS